MVYRAVICSGSVVNQSVVVWYETYTLSLPEVPAE